MTKIDPPAALSRRERAAFRRLVTTLKEVGIDPVARASLISDFVISETRLTTLRSNEAVSEGAVRLQMARAVNTAQAERRRMHKQLFVGARRPPPVLSEEEEDEAADYETRTAAWRDYFRRFGYGSGTLRAKKLAKRFGEPTWTLLLEPL